MSRTSALLQQLLPALTLDLRDELQKQSVSRARQSCAVAADICDNALRQLQDASVQLKRMHNTAFSRAQFPLEIWCLVWSFLPSDRDLINVTHVCASWRSAAVGYPELWTSVRFWTTVHAPRDICDGRACSCPTAAPSHNLQQVEAWLERSKTTQLALIISIYPEGPEHQLAARLAAAVLPHAHRLADVTCECGDLKFFVRFLKEFQRFDSLRTLSVHSIFYPHDLWPLSDLCLDRLQLPRLREIRARGAIEWDVPRPSDYPRTFVALERLSATFLDACSLFDALHSCPRLVLLDAELDDIYDSFRPRALGDDDPALFPRLETVVLDRLTPRWLPHVEPLVRRATMKELTVRHRAFDPDALFKIFEHLSGRLHLSILSGGINGVCVRATEPHTARARVVEFSAADTNSATVSALGHVWRQLPAPDLASLTISWDLRAALLTSALVARQLSRIRLLVVGDVTEGETLEPDDAPRPTLPMLSVLEIASAGGGCAVSAASVRCFAAVLSASELGLLGVDGVQLV